MRRTGLVVAVVCAFGLCAYLVIWGQRAWTDGRADTARGPSVLGVADSGRTVSPTEAVRAIPTTSTSTAAIPPAASSVPTPSAGVSQRQAESGDDITRRQKQEEQAYRELAVLLPRLAELSEQYEELQGRIPVAPKAPPGASHEELVAFVNSEAWRVYTEALIDWELEELANLDASDRNMQELAERFPDAVRTDPGSVSVDYRKLRQAAGGRLSVDTR